MLLFVIGIYPMLTFHC